MTDFVPIEQRSFAYALQIIKLCQVLDQKSSVNRMLSSQLVRSGTSIGANIREAQAAESLRDFIHKREIALKEARETQYWLELIEASEILPKEHLTFLLSETNQIIKILASGIKTAKANAKTNNSDNRSGR